jgi:hypothetical protein
MCIRDLRFLRLWRYKSWFSGVLYSVVWWLDTSVSEGRAASIFEPWRWRQHEPRKLWYPTTRLYGIITQKTSTWRWRQHEPRKLWYPTTRLQDVTTQKSQDGPLKLSYHNTTGRHNPEDWRWRQHGPLKRWHPTATLHSITTQYISLKWP